MMFGDSMEMDLLDCVVGTISEVIESPFGIMLNDISSREKIEMIFVPMSEITRMDFLKQGQSKNLQHRNQTPLDATES
jgi:hypothetical protein